MPRRSVLRLAAAALGAALSATACTGTDAVSQSVGGSLGYGAGDQATTWVSPADRKHVSDVSGSLLDGTPFDLSTWIGHVVVINFWGSWCGPCVGEAPALEQVYRDNRADGVEVVGIDIKEGSAQASSFVRTHHITYPVVSDESNLLALRFPGLPPNATPTTIVLDRQGRIAARHSGAILYTALRDVVRRVVAER